MKISDDNFHHNYAKEAALLLVQCHYTSSEKVAAQLMSSCFVILRKGLGAIFHVTYSWSI